MAKILPSRHPENEKNLDRWRTVRALVDGEASVKSEANRELFFPKLTGHRSDSVAYGLWVAGAYLFPATSRYHEGLIGVVTRDDPEHDAPVSMDSYLADMDGKGAALQAFTRALVHEIAATGRFGVWTRWFDGGLGDGATVSDAEAAGAKAYSKIYPAEDVLSWSYSPAGDLDFVLLRDVRLGVSPDAVDTEENSGLVTPSTAVSEEETFVTLWLDDQGVYQYARWEAEDDEWSLIEAWTPLQSGSPLGRIPFRLGPDKSPGSPPLWDLATVNRSHLRNSAALEHGLQYVGSPQAYITGYDPQEEENMSSAGAADEVEWSLGSSTLITVKNEAANLGILSLSSGDLSGLSEAMKSKREEMALVGGRLLAPDKMAAEAAQTEEIRRQDERNVIQVIAAATEEALSGAMTDAAGWLGVEAEITVAIDVDRLARMTADEALKIASIWLDTRAIAISDVHNLYRRGGILEPERTTEEIIEEVGTPDTET